MKNLFLTLSTILFSLFPFGAADAATLYFIPESGEFRAGQDIVVEFKADSDGQAFNAAQASVQFSKDTLQVKAIDYSPTSSIFNFWLENPAFSNTRSEEHTSELQSQFHLVCRLLLLKK